MGWGKNQKKIRARENTKKKNSCKEEGKEVQRVSPAKKIPAQAKSEKKKFVQAEISPPHHFSYVPSLIVFPLFPFFSPPVLLLPFFPLERDRAQFFSQPSLYARFFGGN